MKLKHKSQAVAVITLALLWGRVTLAQPQLSIANLGDQVMLSWSNSPPYYDLEWRTNAGSGLWNIVSSNTFWVGNQNQYTNLIVFPSRFFRLKSASSNTEVTIDIPSYANLHGRWVYRDTKVGGGGVGPWSVQVLGITNKNSEWVYFLQEYDESDYPNDQAFYHTNFSQGLFETGGLNDYGQPTQNEFYWQPFLPTMMKTFIPGAEYTNYCTRADLPGVVIEVRIKTDAETVSVPYGTLDCCKVTRTLAIDNQVAVVHTLWFARNIGLAKRTDISDGVGDLWELTSYQP
jgi:hypothetical protein